LFMRPGMLLRIVWNYFHKGNTSVAGALSLILTQCLVLIRRGGYRGLRAHINRHIRLQAQPPEDYGLWVAAHAPAPAEREAMARESVEMAYRPVLSIIMPVSEGQEKQLNRSFQSILVQTYPFWELCCFTEGVSLARARNSLEAHSLDDRRIRIIPGSGAGGLSDGLNRALSSATGDFMCLMEPGDEISPDALFELARNINAHPDTDMLYSDEDSIDGEGLRSRPFFKPDWSPEYLESFRYTGHLSAYRTSLSLAIGGFRPGFEGSAQYDFVLRFVEKARNISHLPKVLYHRGRLPDSAGSAPDISIPRNSPLRVLTDRLERLHTGGTARETYPNCFDVRRRIIGNPLISIIIPSAGKTVRVRGRETNLLASCVESIAAKSTYPDYEIIIVDSGNLKTSTVELVSRADCRFVHFCERVPNVAKKMNLGARHARGDHLLFLNDDTEIISADWLEAMLQFSQQPGIGAVGAKLYYEDTSIQHVGVTLNDDGLPDYLCRGFAGSAPGYFFSFVVSRTCLAVTGACLMTRKEVFEQMSGFDEELAMSYNDIDYCLKLYVAGYRTVFTPHAELFHYEFVTRTRTVDFSESDLFLQRWHARVPRDPYYSIHLDTYPPSFRIRRTRLASEGDSRKSDTKHLRSSSE
jgi:GT2 family glycosyltransferase